MQKNWKEIASGSRLPIPEADLERITPALDALEDSFRPLTRGIPPEIEPAVIFRPVEEVE